MNELYKIQDFEGYYADKEGNIYSTLSKGCQNRYDLSKRVAPIKMNYRLTRKGYARVYMRRESTNKREDVYVHRIIATLFIDNPNNLKTVNHKNCIRTDNRVENLEWMSLEDNLKYAMDVGCLGRDKYGRFVNTNKSGKII